MKIYNDDVLTRDTLQLPVAGGEAPDISVFLPVYNEEPNLPPLHAKLDEALAKLGRSAEIVFVDDGSTDGSLKVLREIAALDPRVRVVALRTKLRPNRGDGCGHRCCARQSFDSDGRRSAKRSGRHRSPAGQT